MSFRIPQRVCLTLDSKSQVLLPYAYLQTFSKRLILKKTVRNVSYHHYQRLSMFNTKSERSSNSQTLKLQVRSFSSKTDPKLNAVAAKSELTWLEEVNRAQQENKERIGQNLNKRHISKKRIQYNTRSLDKTKKQNNEKSHKPENDIKQYMSLSNLEVIPLKVANNAVIPKLEHNLDRVLFSPGVHYLQDPRSQVYNFSPYIQDLTSLNKLDKKYTASYTPPEKDKILGGLARKHGKTFYSSTSSMTRILTQFHFLLSNRRPAVLDHFSKYFPEFANLSKSASSPASVFVHYKPEFETYSIDSDQSFQNETVISILGLLMEKFLTTPEAKFEKLKIGESSNSDVETASLNTHHYSTCGDFVMRSQLDCQDSRLPGSGVFDLKTRAVCSVRHDINYTTIIPTNYKIKNTIGRFESFEREQFDLIKSTLLKYGLQARIGNMDGIFIAYHNVSEIFGFQYISLNEIDQIFHTFISADKSFNDKSYKNISDILSNTSSTDKAEIMGPYIADKEFKASLKIWGDLMKKLIKKFPKKSFRLIMNSQWESDSEVLNVIAIPMAEETISVFSKVNTLPHVSEEDKQKLKQLELSSGPTSLSNEVKLILDNIKALGEKSIEKIEEVNSKCYKDAIGLKVRVKHYFDGFLSKQQHPMPNSTKTDWGISYSIDEISHSETVRKFISFENQRYEIYRHSLLSGNPEDEGSVDEFIAILRAYGSREVLKNQTQVNSKKENKIKPTIWTPQTTTTTGAKKIN